MIHIKEQKNSINLQTEMFDVIMYFYCK